MAGQRSWLAVALWGAVHSSGDGVSWGAASLSLTPPFATHLYAASYEAVFTSSRKPSQLVHHTFLHPPGLLFQSLEHLWTQFIVCAHPPMIRSIP